MEASIRMGKLEAQLIGGLGNQLFILAHGYKLAKEQGKELVIGTSKWDTSQGEYPETYKDTMYKNFEFGRGEPIPVDYYQGLKYFEPYGDEFVKKLNIPAYKTDRVAVHIRRGDYLKYHKHNVCTKEYYDRAMDMFDAEFTIFTDDIEYAEKNYSEHLINLSPPRLALAYMASHKAVICSNSSFSWWASYIGGCKTIVPDRWYNGKEDKDIYRPEMIRLEI